MKCPCKRKTSITNLIAENGKQKEMWYINDPADVEGLLVTLGVISALIFANIVALQCSVEPTEMARGDFQFLLRGNSDFRQFAKTVWTEENRSFEARIGVGLRNSQRSPQSSQKTRGARGTSTSCESGGVDENWHAGNLVQLPLAYHRSVLLLFQYVQRQPYQVPIHHPGMVQSASAVLFLDPCVGGFHLWCPYLGLHHFTCWQEVEARKAEGRADEIVAEQVNEVPVGGNNGLREVVSSQLSAEVCEDDIATE
eukprot:CAMPEP_0204123216 /NCGR_PEP_ID=MMETSP0361-20130328/9159_1 /ASSEMBLY_ACC=CAM_ASM_000343 /TAXON_ID=268821 /ORGANISM="Scrippsiella Hangoei, Strain SHTV-5" /LENGTH=253 /DNA_ID=CAMNT_0051074631 /DNA_START=1 /DNA_END=763 /DNA_ORIENTATION=+